MSQRLRPDVSEEDVNESMPSRSYDTSFPPCEEPNDTPFDINEFLASIKADQKWCIERLIEDVHKEDELKEVAASPPAVERDYGEAPEVPILHQIDVQDHSPLEE